MRALLNVLHVSLCKFVKSFARNETAHHVLSLPLKEQRRLVQSLATYNKSLRTELEKQDALQVYKAKAPFSCLARFNQLPCSVDTRKRRADLFEKRGYQNKIILLLGDDDLLSVELAEREFKSIFVADCDEKLLATIEEKTRHSKYPPVCLYANFFSDDTLSVDADVICFDPPYNACDAEKFLNYAMRHTHHKPSVALYMMLNPYAVGRNGVDNLRALLRQSGFHFHQRFAKFNSYPLNRYAIAVLNIAQLILLTLGSDSLVNWDGCFFSDCFEYVKDALL